MAHIIPSLRTASHARYTLPASRRAAATNGAESGTTDFRTVLKDETAPAVATPTSTTEPATTTVHSIGTMTPWSPTVTRPAPPATTTVMAPTAESLFGPNPWVTNAGGTGPNGSYSYNPRYFATPETAAKVAQMLGGTVVQLDAITPSGPFKQNQPNLMVKMPDGRLVNAGLIAGLYTCGFSQQTVDAMIATETQGKLG